ncbi:MAG: phosphopantetheine-binding protein [Nocardioides sp.]
MAAHTRVPVPYSHLTPGPATHPAEVRVDPAEVRVDPAEVRVDPAEVRVDPAEVRVEQPTTAVDPVLAEVTAVVSEMTGYPPELLDPDLDLEADLGVDTVKQAEVFAAVRARYDVERDDTLRLRDFPTLRHVTAWVREKAGLPETTAVASVAAAPEAVAPAPAEPPAPAVDPVLAEVTAVVSEMTGYPEELLDPDLDLEADLGVDTVKQAEVFAAVRAEYDVERDDTLQLRDFPDFPTLRHVTAWVREATVRRGFPRSC